MQENSKNDRQQISTILDFTASIRLFQSYERTKSNEPIGFDWPLSYTFCGSLHYLSLYRRKLASISQKVLNITKNKYNNRFKCRRSGRPSNFATLLTLSLSLSLSLSPADMPTTKTAAVIKYGPPTFVCCCSSGIPVHVPLYKAGKTSGRRSPTQIWISEKFPETVNGFQRVIYSLPGLTGSRADCVASFERTVQFMVLLYTTVRFSVIVFYDFISSTSSCRPDEIVTASGYDGVVVRAVTSACTYTID